MPKAKDIDALKIPEKRKMDHKRLNASAISNMSQENTPSLPLDTQEIALKTAKTKKYSKNKRIHQSKTRDIEVEMVSSNSKKTESRGDNTGKRRGNRSGNKSGNRSGNRSGN